jgi:hypothetical protein
MNRSLSLLLLISTVCVPSCVIYDAELLEQAVGAEDGTGSGSSGGGTGQGSGASGGDGDGDFIATGGMVGIGGSDPLAGGSSQGGGAGGGSGDSGGNSGSGGEPPSCDDIGSTADFSGVGSLSLVDDFEQAWTNLGKGVTYTGWWYVAKDDAANTSLSPDVGTWSYEEDACSDTDALHITGTGYTTWGASFDAQLMDSVAEIDLSGYTGVAFWARSNSSNQLKIGISDGDDSNGTTPIESTPIFLGQEWEQHLIPFPGSANMSQAKVLHFVVVASATFDLWLDDVNFYVAE